MTNQPAPASPAPEISVIHLGQEREPVVIIDNCTGKSDELEAIARQAPYEQATGYPGIRCRISSSYLAPQGQLLRQVLATHFAMPGGAKAERCDFSIVTIPSQQLSEGQRRPHYDAADAGLLALLHYTGGPETGGTAFYRHRRTGFETIRPERVSAFAAGVRQDEREFGALPARYFFGDDERYEMIGHVEARKDRVLLYRGRQLHSGHIPAEPDPATAPARGRLTINTFLVGA